MRKPSIASQAVIYTDKISILPFSLIRPDTLGSTTPIPELTALVILHPMPSPSQPHRIPSADLGGGTFPDTPEDEVTYPEYPGWVVKGGAGSPPRAWILATELHCDTQAGIHASDSQSQEASASASPHLGPL